MASTVCSACGKEITHYKQWMEEDCPKSPDGHLLSRAEWLTIFREPEETK